MYKTYGHIKDYKVRMQLIWAKAMHHYHNGGQTVTKLLQN